MIVKLAAVDDFKPNTWYEFSLESSKGLMSIMVQYINNQYVAFENFCPHQGRRMDYATGKFLISDSETIVCPAHGAEFNPLNGLCINGPCLGESLKPIKIKANEEDIFAIIE
ncbi:MAG: Rieske (2Fe-2S) protein [Marinicellaceae bacterium]